MRTQNELLESFVEACNERNRAITIRLALEANYAERLVDEINKGRSK